MIFIGVCMSTKTLKKFIEIVLENQIDEAELDEMCGAGGVVGMQLPLGANPDMYGGEEVRTEKSGTKRKVKKKKRK